MRLKAAIFSSILFVAAACGGGSPSGGGTTAEANAIDSVELKAPVSITLWHALTGDPQKSALENAIKQFNDTVGKERGITVTGLVQGNYTQLGQKALGAIQAGALPDLIHAYESNVADYMKADVVLNLDPYVQSKKYGLDKAGQDDIYQGYYDTNRFKQFNNQLLSWPFTKSLAVTYQNDDLLKEIGKQPAKTWEDFEANVKALAKKGPDGKVTRYGWAVPTDASYFDAMVYSRGGKLMADDNKTVAWNGKEGLDTLKMVDRLVKDGSAYVPPGFTGQDDFAASRVGYYMSSTSSLPFVKAAFKTPINWSVVNFPQADPAKAKTVQFGANVAVLKTTPEKQLASWLFVKWFSETDQTASWATTSYYMPVRKTAADKQVVKDFWAKNPQSKQAFDMIGVSAPEPNVRGQQDIRDVILEMMTKITTQKATPEDAIKVAGDKANRILKDNQ
ncbi:MAG: ABC transporter substrate-binding protein [Chloroflexi bacterium]|nr:ABC transporter substrate-binding protein [Chloroflexota bacterium]